jgi:hypothetical protein
MSATTRILVVGDTTVDWQAILPDAAVGRGLDLQWAWATMRPTRLAARPGGAALLHEIVTGIAAEVAPQAEVVGPPVPAEALTVPDYPGLTRMMSAWAEVPRVAGDPSARVWRMARFLGQERAATALLPPALDPDEASVVAVCDLDLGFRDTPDAWPSVLDSSTPPRHVLVQMAAPLASGPLWQRLAERYPDEVTVFTLAEDFRKDSLPVGYALSWEQIQRDVVTAVRESALSRVARVVVLVGLAGAVVVERACDPVLVFSPRAQEGDLARSWPGTVVGPTMCVLGAVAAELSGETPDVAAAVRAGVAAAQILHREGYEHDGRGLRFPLDRVRAALRTPTVSLATVRLPVEDGRRTILTEVLGASRLSAVAERAAVRGPDELLAGIPIDTVGAWSSVDRDEIESMRSVRGIMAEYTEAWSTGGRLERPLSIAVFGPPGAGKSFAVKQMARVLLPGKMKELEFNLSQFHDEGELPASFHRVRDLVLQQHLPLVFWDEFDTPLGAAPLGWLRHFLAPMQDGVFRESGAYHPIGPAIFVFAGGTSATLEEFVTAGDEERSRQAKKPDFLSRLRGFVNVYGPNPRDEHDHAYVLRRAFLLRSLLQRKAPQVVDGSEVRIDPGVLRAFLGIDRFTHGARSMEAVVDMSALAGKPRYERASLPPVQQLALHVDAVRFLELARAAPSAS